MTNSYCFIDIVQAFGDGELAICRMEEGRVLAFEIDIPLSDLFIERLSGSEKPDQEIETPWYDDSKILESLMSRLHVFKALSPVKCVRVVTQSSGSNAQGSIVNVSLYTPGSQQQYDIPGPPGKPAVSTISPDSVALEWSKPLRGVANVTSYVVSYQVSDESTDDNVVQKRNSADTKLELTGLIPGVKYVFSVQAECDVGVSAHSEESDAVLMKSVHADVSFPLPPVAKSKKESKAVLQIRSEEGSPYWLPFIFTCHVTSCDTTSECDIEKAADTGKYNITFTPSSRGKHCLKLEADSIQICGSPFDCHVFPHPSMRGTPLRTIPVPDEPYGIGVSDDGLIAVGTYQRDHMCLFDKEFQPIGTWGFPGSELKGAIYYPAGIIFTKNGSTIVAGQHRLQKFTLDGYCQMTVGGASGNEQLQFNCPRGIAAHPVTGDIYIADHNNHRVQVIDTDFKFVRSIKGSLNQPYDVAFDSQNNLYVTNFSGHCIDVFTSDGTHLRRFGSEGTSQGQVKHPAGIAIDQHDVVYVAEYSNHRISLFYTDGQFIRHFGSEGSSQGQFNNPYGIAIDKLGNLYVCDKGNKRVVVL